jgi:hypothetical protein
VTRNGAVFIDRDPDHFCFVLKHLRNRMELATAQHFEKGGLRKIKAVYVDLPKDPKVLSELYVEAAFYRIPELQSALCKSSITSYVASIFNKEGNPFDMAAKLLARLRTLVLTVGTVSGTMFVTINDDWNALLQKVGIGATKKAGDAVSGIVNG